MNPHEYYRQKNIILTLSFGVLMRVVKGELTWEDVQEEAKRHVTNMNKLNEEAEKASTKGGH